MKIRRTLWIDEELSSELDKLWPQELVHKPSFSGFVNDILVRSIVEDARIIKMNQELYDKISIQADKMSDDEITVTVSGLITKICRREFEKRGM